MNFLLSINCFPKTIIIELNLIFRDLPVLSTTTACPTYMIAGDLNGMVTITILIMATIPEAVIVATMGAEDLITTLISN